MEDETTDLETLIDKIRVPKSQIKVIRELLIVIIGLIFFSLGFVAFGLIQYWTCTMKNPEIEVLQCFRGDYARPSRNRPRD